MSIVIDILLALWGTFFGFLLSLMVEHEQSKVPINKNEDNEVADKNTPKKQTMLRCIVAGITLVLSIAIAICYCCQYKENNKINELNTSAVTSVCREYFEKGQYSNALDTILVNGVKDADSSMVYAYFLANGYGIEKNIPLSIKYYTAAMEMGDPRAETNMVISVAKNCVTKQKIEIIREAYRLGNETAIRYVEYMVNCWNSTPENTKNQIEVSEIWQLEDNDILSILNGEFYEWVVSNKTYTTSVSVVNSEDFTRRFLYQIGDSRVYEECQLIVRDTFPSWLKENIW